MHETPAPDPVDADQRERRLSRRLAQLERDGAEIEERRSLRAVVRVRMRESILPNVVMGVGGIALFAIDHGVLFLAAAALSIVGWRRKRDAATMIRRVLVRVDEHGRVRETELSRTRMVPAT